MAGHGGHSFLSLIAPRPAQEPADVPLVPEPDTPMHHAHRGLPAAVWRHKLLTAAQILLVFLLIVGGGTWLFIDTEHLQLRNRGESSRAGQTRYLLPDGSLSSDPQLEEDAAQETLFQEGEFGLSHYSDELEDDKLVMPTARERWIGNLDPITVQSVTADPPKIDKTIQVVILTPECCRPSELVAEAQVMGCHRRVMQSCSALGPSDCFSMAVKSEGCRHTDQPPDHKLTYLAGLDRLVPFLAELGWTGIQVHRNFLQQKGLSSQNSTCPISAEEQQAAKSALDRAAIVIADLQHLDQLLLQYPRANFIFVEPSETATLPPRVATNFSHLTDSRVRAIWRAQVLHNSEYQNGPLLAGSFHLATLPGAWRTPMYTKQRQPLLSYATVESIRPLLSHAFRFRYPLDCGGNIEHLRFAGAFQQNFSHWQPQRIARRKVDIAFIGRMKDGGTSQKDRRTEGELLMQHRQTLVRKLRLLQAKLPRLSVLLKRQRPSTYGDYLAQLQDIKIMVSPYSTAEWSEQDFEAILCGCLLVKVNPAAYTVYPDVFRVKKHVLTATSDWNGLEDALLTALQDLEHTQRMADRATVLLLEYSDMRRYAGDIDIHLTHLVRNMYFTALSGIT